MRPVRAAGGDTLEPGPEPWSRCREVFGGRRTVKRACPGEENTHEAGGGSCTAGREGWPARPRGRSAASRCSIRPPAAPPVPLRSGWRLPPVDASVRRSQIRRLAATAMTGPAGAGCRQSLSCRLHEERRTERVVTAELQWFPAPRALHASAADRSAATLQRTRRPGPRRRSHCRAHDARNPPGTAVGAGVTVTSRGNCALSGAPRAARCSR